MKTPGTALEMKRRENNMTQEEVAKYLGISRNTLAAYESGKQKIPLTVFIYLADLYKCHVYFNAGGESVENSSNAFTVTFSKRGQAHDVSK